MGAPLPALSRERFSRRLGSAVDGMLTAKTVDHLYAHYEELRRWNPRLSLIGPGTTDDAVEVHYAESLLGRELIEPGDRLLVDLGSGAGFPGVPLAAALPNLDVWLIEPQSRKWAFLRSAVSVAGLECRCLDRRLESDFPVEFPCGVDVVTVRALKLDPEVWKEIADRLAPGGRLLRWGAAEPPAELEGWRPARSVRLPGRQRWILELRPPA